MRIVYRGNFGVSFSTESHIAASLGHLGHEVIQQQENVIPWDSTVRACEYGRADLFLWTSTHSYAEKWGRDIERAALARIKEITTTAAVHLDLFWGLRRQTWIEECGWFRCDHVFTADGDHDADFAAAGVNHHWLLPGVYHAECVPGTPRAEYAADVAFVGAWTGGYHREWWPQRKALIDFLKQRYGSRLALWPKPNQPAVRGQDLNDLYASVEVVVGDSCFADRAKRYTSDRVYETVGRGGFLLYPRIEAVAEELRDGEHLRFYTVGDFDGLGRMIDESLADAKQRESVRLAGQARVKADCTYLNRMQTMLGVIG